MINLRKALLIHFASSSGSTFVQFIVSVLLARLLSPEQIGVYSITIVLVNIAHVFREFGVGSYLQRESDLTPAKIRSAMGVAYITTWSIAALIYLSSGRVAKYFGYQEIEPVMHVLALSFVFIPFSSIVLALLIREYNAIKIAWASVWGTLAYSVTALSLAYAGFGTMSLAWANFANILATGIAFVPMRPKGLPWIPSLRNVGSVARFGGGVLSSNFLKAVNNALPDLLLGKIGTAHQVGLISRANSTVSIFMYVAGSAINFGSESYLAKAYHAKKSFEPLLSRAAALVSGVGWPALAVTALMGYDIVFVLYGSAWVDCAPAIAPLAASAAMALMFHYAPAAFNAVGRPYLAALPLALTAASRIVFAMILFANSVASFAWVLTLATALVLPIWLYLQERYAGCSIRYFLKALLPSLLVTLACAAVCVLGLEVMSHLGVTSSYARIGLLVVPLCLTWLSAIRMCSHPLLHELGLLAQKMKSVVASKVG